MTDKAASAKAAAASATTASTPALKEKIADDYSTYIYSAVMREHPQWARINKFLERPEMPLPNDPSTIVNLKKSSIFVTAYLPRYNPETKSFDGMVLGIIDDNVVRQLSEMVIYVKGDKNYRLAMDTAAQSATAGPDVDDVPRIQSKDKHHILQDRAAGPAPLGVSAGDNAMESPCLCKNATKQCDACKAPLCSTACIRKHMRAHVNSPKHKRVWQRRLAELDS
jgi:hypothetical protein